MFKYNRTWIGFFEKAGQLASRGRLTTVVSYLIPITHRQQWPTDSIKSYFFVFFLFFVCGCTCSSAGDSLYRGKTYLDRPAFANEFPFSLVLFIDTANIYLFINGGGGGSGDGTNRRVTPPTPSFVTDVPVISVIDSAA